MAVLPILRLFYLIYLDILQVCQKDCAVNNCLDLCIANTDDIEGDISAPYLLPSHVIICLGFHVQCSANESSHVTLFTCAVNPLFFLGKFMSIWGEVSITWAKKNKKVTEDLQDLNFVTQWCMNFVVQILLALKFQEMVFIRHPLFWLWPVHGTGIVLRGTLHSLHSGAT